jgi:hypothetical protein
VLEPVAGDAEAVLGETGNNERDQVRVVGRRTHRVEQGAFDIRRVCGWRAVE